MCRMAITWRQSVRGSFAAPLRSQLKGRAERSAKEAAQGADERVGQLA